MSGGEGLGRREAGGGRGGGAGGSAAGGRGGLTKDILGRIVPGRPVFLFLDYDGTLVPIRGTPGEVRLHPARRSFLGELAGRAFVGIVSGRSIRDLRGQIRLENVAYIGNHGLEISWRGWDWVHPAAARAQSAVEDALEAISRRSGDFEGALTEHKGVTGSVHYRRLAPGLRDGLRRIVQEEVRRRRRDIKLTEGKKVFEIRPNLDWGKGKGVLKLIGRLETRQGRARTATRVYVGDDRTDEDAFRELGPDAVTVLVGGKTPTNARFGVPDVEHVWRLLRLIRGRASVSYCEKIK